MFAYGDTSRAPVPETVDVLEALTVLFVRKVVTRALDHVRTASLTLLVADRACRAVQRRGVT